MEYFDDIDDLNSHLLKACKENDLAQVKICISAGADIEIQEKETGKTPLHYAVENEYTGIIKELTNTNVKNIFEITDLDQLTPLHYAAIYSDGKVLKYLCNEMDRINKANFGDSEINIYKNSSINPVHYAILAGSMKNIEILINSGFVQDTPDLYKESVLQNAVAFGDKNMVDMLIKNGFSYKTGIPVGSDILLRMAVEKGKLDVAQCLLENGSPVDCKDKHGSTLLHYAARNEDIRLVEILIDAGAKFDQKNFEGKTPFHYAAEKGGKSIIDALLLSKGERKRIVDGIKDTIYHHKSGNVLNQTDECGMTPLHIAVKNKNTEIVKYLIELGADLKIEAKGKFSLMHMAGNAGNEEIVNTFLDRGFDINEEDEFGSTPLHWSVFNEDSRILDLLMQKGAKDCNQRVEGYLTTNKITSPLELAIHSKRPDMVESLLKNFVDGDSKNKEGETPLTVLIKEGHSIFCAGKSKLFYDKLLLAQSDVENQDNVLKYIAENLFKKNPELKTILDKDKFEKVMISDIFNDNNLSNQFYNAKDIVKNNGEMTALLEKTRNSKENQELNQFLMAACYPNEIVMKQKEYTNAHIMMDKLITYGVNIDNQNNMGATPLHYAIANGDEEMVSKLLKEGADTDKNLNINQLTPLHVAALKGNKNIFDILLEYGADIELLSEDGKTPIDYLCITKENDYLKTLQNRIGSEQKLLGEFFDKVLYDRELNKISIDFYKNNLENVPQRILDILRNGDKQGVKANLKSGADIRFMFGIHFNNKQKNNSLQKFKDVLEELVKEKKFEIAQGETLSKSIFNEFNKSKSREEHIGICDIVKEKIEGVANGIKKEALKFAEKNRRMYPIVDALKMYAEISYNQQNSFKEGRIIYNIINKIETTKQLNEYKDLLNKYITILPDEIKNAALILAVKNSNFKATRILLNSGASCNAKDINTDSVLMIATRRNAEATNSVDIENTLQIANRLIEQGANVNYLNKNGFTPLFYSKKSREDEVLSYLTKDVKPDKVPLSIGEKIMYYGGFCHDVRVLNAKYGQMQTTQLMAAGGRGNFNLFNGILTRIEDINNSGNKAIIDNMGKDVIFTRDSDGQTAMSYVLGAYNLGKDGTKIPGFENYGFGIITELLEKRGLDAVHCAPKETTLRMMARWGVNIGKYMGKKGDILIDKALDKAVESAAGKSCNIM